MYALSTILGLLLLSITALADFTSQCSQVCLAADSPNILVSECNENSWSPSLINKGTWTWTELDLNLIVGYENSQLVFKIDGNFATGDDACTNLFYTDAILFADCPDGPADLDLSGLKELLGPLCYMGGMFTVCGEATTRTC
ncbi:hypothetical protein SEUCBS139899_010561 [Sporothrix eucalyptigena]